MEWQCFWALLVDRAREKIHLRACAHKEFTPTARIPQGSFSLPPLHICNSFLQKWENLAPSSSIYLLDPPVCNWFSDHTSCLLGSQPCCRLQRKERERKGGDGGEGGSQAPWKPVSVFSVPTSPPQQALTSACLAFLGHTALGCACLSLFTLSGFQEGFFLFFLFYDFLNYKNSSCSFLQIQIMQSTECKSWKSAAMPLPRGNQTKIVVWISLHFSLKFEHKKIYHNLLNRHIRMH